MCRRCRDALRLGCAVRALLLSTAAVWCCALLWMAAWPSDGANLQAVEQHAGVSRACATLTGDTSFTHAGSTPPQLMELHDVVTAHYLYYEAEPPSNES